MNFVISRKITNRVFAVEIQFDGLGSDTLTKEDEAKLYSEFGYPVIDLGGSFSGSFGVGEFGTVEAKDDGLKMEFLMNSKKAELKEGFIASYKISLDHIDKVNIDAIHLPTKEKVAEARCLLFEATISKRIQEAINATQEKANSFEVGYPKNLIV